MVDLISSAVKAAHQQLDADNCMQSLIGYDPCLPRWVNRNHDEVYILEQSMPHETFTAPGIAIDSSVVYAVLLFAAFVILARNNVYPNVIEIFNCIRASFVNTNARRNEEQPEE